ncbi:Maf family protein [Phreatobacter cathodiphilus]|uniref:Nucleoside triphosphate pyrophosphatase n=1 Tax=Phreatobacter cathodiphilus TaxID=1868589 RepID=A0A2S0NF77_9HYPH|nr:Maf family protein [Phreatobacter cathodiphilus]AVO46812.1 septum formation inhibitor Maf [Phreatobacter cathodiphilus]
MTRLVLASKSAARAAMLRQAGLAVDLTPADIDERALDEALAREGRDPAAIARALGEAKALAVSRAHPEAVVIGADQTLALGPRRFSKPVDLQAARANLLALRGRTHHLHSGVALARGGTILFSAVASAAMTMRPFSDAFLDAYLAGAGERLLSSVGCYQLEAEGIQLFERIEGDYFTILGMPLLPLLAALRTLGIAAT